MDNLLIWPGWYAGLLIGGYMLMQLWISNRQLGCSLAYGHVCAVVSRASYFRDSELSERNNWRLWFILGIPLGGFLAALTSPGDMALNMSMGTYYDQVLPSQFELKALVLIFAGVLMGLGARLAGGCTSGHVIMGIPLLNGPSMLAAGLFFVSALVTVQLMFFMAGG